MRPLFLFATMWVTAAWLPGGALQNHALDTQVETPEGPPMLGNRGRAESCPTPPAEHAQRGIPSPDLYCVRLLGSTAAPDAEGWARLIPAPTPFGIAVDRDGLVQNGFILQVHGLPAPEELGPYERYMAWITPPGLSPMVPLGEVTNGISHLDPAGFNQYLFLVSAEPRGRSGEGPTGPLVLRGTSPAMVLRPHDLPYILAEMTPDPGSAGEAHGSHGEWRPPPMNPEIAMPDEIMRLRPGVSPFLPFPDSTDGVAAARPPSSVRLADGDTLVLEAGPVMRRVGHLLVPGYGFNGQSPGPRIESEEGARVHVRFRNRTPLRSAVHWHGLRLDWRFDGAPGVTQDPVEPGDDFHYELHLPDEGTFWYHPHLREDVMQNMGLAGNIRVHPRGDGWYDAADHEEYLVLNDLLVGPEGPVPYGLEAPTQALMGRFGNILLVNGARGWSLDARPGETIRLHLTNAASTRTFNLSLAADTDGPLPLKVVASDVGAMPRSVEVGSVVIAPAERWTVEVHVPESLEAGTRILLENRVQALDHLGARFLPRVDTLGQVRVSGEPSPDGPQRARAFRRAREREALAEEVDRLMTAVLDREPDHTLVLDLRVQDLPFPLDPLLTFEGAYRAPVEWDGTMPDMDWLATGASVEWILRDPETGAENMEVDWRFRQGDRVKLRLVNSRQSVHPMQHPIHLHGQRFLVVSVDGVPNPHPAWKDTVLVPVGSVVDLLAELDNPGPWMLHCHIAEHLETGMMSVIHVDAR